MRKPPGTKLSLSFLVVLLLLIGAADFVPGCSHGGHEATPHHRVAPQSVLDRAMYLLHHERAPEADALLQGLEKEGPEASDGDDRGEVTALLCRASLLEQQQDLAGAEKLLGQASNRLLDLSGNHWKKIANILVHRARILSRLNRADSADASLAIALDMVRRAENSGARMETLILEERKKLLRSTGDYEKELRRAIEEHQKLLGPDHPFVARGLYHLALVMEDKGRNSEAEEYYLQSMGIHEKLLGPTHPVVATFHTHLAAIFRSQGEYAKAKVHLAKTIKIYEDTLQETEPERIQALKTMVQRTQVDVTPVAEALIEFEEKNFGPSHPNVARSLRYYAMLYESGRQYERAEPMIRRALKIYEEAFPPDYEEVLFTRKRLAACLHTLGKGEEAVSLARETLRREEARYGKGSSSTLSSVCGLAVYLQETGKLQEAEEHFRSALESYQAKGVVGDAFLQNLAAKLVGVYVAQGKEEDAGRLRSLLQEDRPSEVEANSPLPCPRHRDGEPSASVEQRNPRVDH